MKSVRYGVMMLLLLGLVLAACAGSQEAAPLVTITGAELQQQPTSVIEEGRPAVSDQPTSAPIRPTIAEFPLSYGTPRPVGAIANWSAPPYNAPLALRPDDHFYFQRPLASDVEAWLHSSYRYGNSHFGEETTHTGVDFVTDMWTPVLATGDGVVVWAGYGLYRGIEDETDPYGLAIAIEHTFGYEGQRLYTVYGHLADVDVIKGQRVDAGQVIGRVGNTGKVSGPHLHYEIRLGENRYFHSYNPELWMVPLEGTGVLAARILDSQGRKLIEYPVHIYNLETTIETLVWTYAKDTIHSDPVYAENMVVGDLPAGPYEVYINYVGHKFAAQFYLRPGQTNVITFNGRDGFELEN